MVHLKNKMAEISGNFYKLVEKRLENIEKEVKSTQDTVRVITDRAEEYGRRCELVSNRLEDLSEGMHTLNDTVDCLSEGLIALPSMIEPANAFSGCKSVSSSLINTYVTQFQSIYNVHVKRAIRKRLDHSVSPQSGVNSHGQRSISDIEGHARDSVRRRLGLNEEELRRLESFKLLSTDGEDAFAGKLDPNNNSLILGKASTNLDCQNVMGLLSDLSMEDHESSHSLSVAIATVHAANATDDPFELGYTTADAGLELHEDDT